jgi:hypothetical protein
MPSAGKFFRVHFQFVMANEVPHAYDFFMIVCGPVPLPSAWRAGGRTDGRHRRRTAAEWAWKQLENARSGRKMPRKGRPKWNPRLSAPVNFIGVLSPRPGAASGPPGLALAGGLV